MPAPGFLQDLRRHHVVRVGVTYAVVGWLIIQIVAIIFPLLQFPGWLARTLVVLVLAGFPFALVLAWAFQEPGDAQRVTASGRRRSRRIGLSLGAVGVLIAILGGVVWWYFGPIENTLRDAEGSQASASTTINPKSIAVLPL